MADKQKASLYVQWKGTDLCGDFTCECGKSFHIDADFVYNIQCLCGALYQVPYLLELKRVNEPEKGTPVYEVQDCER